MRKVCLKVWEKLNVGAVGVQMEGRRSGGRISGWAAGLKSGGSATPRGEPLVTTPHSTKHT